MSVPALTSKQHVDTRACSLHLRTLAALMCTNRQLRVLINSPELDAAWAQACSIQGFDWRRWRPVSSTGAATVLCWLQPRAGLIKHLHLDLHSRKAALAFPMQLAAAPITHLSCLGHVPLGLEFTGLRCLAISMTTTSETQVAALAEQLPRLTALEQLSVECGSRHHEAVGNLRLVIRCGWAAGGHY